MALSTATPDSPDSYNSSKAHTVIDLRENTKIVNAKIQEALLEVLPIASPAIQLEIHDLIKQVRYLNELLISNKHHHALRFLNKSNEPLQYFFILDEIKNLLVLVKSNKISINFLRKFRIGLQKEINSYRYPISSLFLNTLLSIANITSSPVKLCMGLLITTSITTTLFISIVNKLYSLDAIIHSYETKVQQNSLIQKSTSFPSSTSFNTLRTPDNLVDLDNMIHRNKFVWYASSYAAIAGLLGSVASILLRIIDFKDTEYEDPLTPFFVGLFKPLIGLLFGIFIFTLITSNTLIKIDFLASQEQSKSAFISAKARQDLLIFSCAFLIGFSERFASDLLKKTGSSIIEK